MSVDLSFGLEYEFLSADGAFYPRIATLDSNKFVVAYRDNADSGHGTAKIGTVDGTDVTFGVESEFASTGAANNMSVDVFNQSDFVVLYNDIFDSSHGTAKKGVVTGTTIVFGDETEFLSANFVGLTSVAVLGESKFVIVYQDGSDSNHGTAKIGEIIVATSIIQTGRQFDWFVKTPDYFPQVVGAFSTAIVDVNIQIWDVTNGLNTIVLLTSSGCYAIGNTGQWGWSTANLSLIGENHYYFRMISNENTNAYGEFWITVLEDGRWSSPDNISDNIILG